MACSCVQLLVRRTLGISCHISGEQIRGLAYPESLGCLGTYFEAAGYQAVALTRPDLDRPIKALLGSPATTLAKLNVVDIVDHYAAEIGDISPKILRSCCTDKTDDFCELYQ